MLTRVDIEFGDDERNLTSPPVGRTSLLKWGCIGVVIIAFTLAAQLILSGMSEGYCWVWPGIGTRFAAGFSHSGYARINPGMTQAEVVRILGWPLSSSLVRGTPHGFDDKREPGDEAWQYSTDSSDRGGDWAWLSREVVFRGGVVHHTHAWTFYD